MNYSAALEQIHKGQIGRLYLLYGEEGHLLKEVERRLVAALLKPEELDLNLTVLEREPSDGELAELVETVPFMGGKHVVVVRDSQRFRPRKGDGADNGDKHEEQLLKLLGNIPEYSCLVFTAAYKADKRRKLFKVIEKYGAAVEGAPLKGKDVRPWLSEQLALRKKQMSADAMEYFMEIVNTMTAVSLGFLSNELDKLSLFTGSRKNITRQDLENCMAKIPEVSVFAMMDAISSRDLSSALTLLAEQLKAGDHPLRMIPLFANQVRRLWQVKELQGGAAVVAAQLGVAPFIAEKMLRQSRNFSRDRLKGALLALAAADSDLKSGRAEKTVLEDIIVELCRK